MQTPHSTTALLSLPEALVQSWFEDLPRWLERLPLPQIAASWLTSFRRVCSQLGVNAYRGAAGKELGTTGLQFEYNYTQPAPCRAHPMPSALWASTLRTSAPNAMATWCGDVGADYVDYKTIGSFSPIPDSNRLRHHTKGIFDTSYN